jgi:hypothetical protein
VVDQPPRIEPLGPQYDRSTFDCGTEALERYLRMQADKMRASTWPPPFILVPSVYGRLRDWRNGFEVEGQIDARTAPELRMLQQRPSAIRHGCVDMLFRMHILRGLLRE